MKVIIPRRRKRHIYSSLFNVGNNCSMLKWHSFTRLLLFNAINNTQWRTKIDFLNVSFNPVRKLKVQNTEQDLITSRLSNISDYRMDSPFSIHSWKRSCNGQSTALERNMHKERLGLIILKNGQASMFSHFFVLLRGENGGGSCLDVASALTFLDPLTQVCHRLAREMH
jgi:hypothetical protein